MAVSSAEMLHRMALAALGWLAVFAGGDCLAAAARPAPGVPIVLDAQSADADLATNHVVFHKVKIAQGDMSVVADLGQGTQPKARTPNSLADSADFQDSLWLFRGSVKISVAQGELSSDDAQINFVNQGLSKAVVNGKPATFEERVAKTGKLAQGHADTIDYDAGRHLVRLTKNAWLSDGQTEIRGEALKYDVVAQSIVAEASEQNNQRVHIVITPPPAKP